MSRMTVYFWYFMPGFALRYLTYVSSLFASLDCVAVFFDQGVFFRQG